MSCYTLEKKVFNDKVHTGDFLWPAEREFMHHFMIVQQDAFTWDDAEHGHFREDFFLPVEMSIIAHKPWVSAKSTLSLEHPELTYGFYNTS